MSGGQSPNKRKGDTDMKLVINRCYGGFSLSRAACNALNCDRYDFSNYDERSDPRLVALVEEKGSDFCSGSCANLVVVELPDSITDYSIEDYDGLERVIYVFSGKLHWA